MTLAESQAAYDAAKATFFDTGSEKDRAAVAKADAELAKARLDAERTKHHTSLASQARAEAERHEREQELARLRTLDAERQTAIDDAILELVNLERTAHTLVDEITRLTTARQGAFHQRKQLALLLDSDAAERAPSSVNEARIELAVEIRRARIADGRDAGATDMVSAWLQPAVRVYPRVARAK